MFNPNCEFYDEEPNEYRKCFLLGYRINCDSQECKKARSDYEKFNRVSSKNDEQADF